VATSAIDRRKIPGKPQAPRFGGPPRARSRLLMRAEGNPDLDPCITVTVSLLESQVDALDDRADERNTNRSALVREILSNAGIG
jgi:hypothetical protein